MQGRLQKLQKRVQEQTLDLQSQRSQISATEEVGALHSCLIGLPAEVPHMPCATSDRLYRHQQDQLADSEAAWQENAAVRQQVASQVYDHNDVSRMQSER